MTEFKYRAFVSYSHKDQKWGRWLHRALETFNIPKELVGQETEIGITPKRLGKVFRDDDELGTAADLSQKITSALENSDVLIVVCSPNAAKSKWVNEEILEFKSLGRSHRIFAVIVDGEPFSSEPDTECLPEALRYAVDENGKITDEMSVPLATDVRKYGKEDSVLRLVSGLLGIDYDFLKNREGIRARRRLLRAQAFFFSGSLLLLFSLLAVFLATIQTVSNENNRSLLFAERADSLNESGKNDEALLWALAGIAQPSQIIGPDDTHARAQFIRAYRENRVLNGHEGGVDSVEFSFDGKRIVTTSTNETGENGVARIWDTESGTVLIEIESESDFIDNAFFDPTGKRVVTVSDDRIEVWDSESGTNLHIFMVRSLNNASLSSDGTRIISSSALQHSKIWDLETGAEIIELETPASGSRDAKFNSDGSRVFLAPSFDNTVYILDSSTGEQINKLIGHTDEITDIATSQNGTYVATLSRDRVTRVWDAESGAPTHEYVGTRGLAIDLRFNESETLIAVINRDATVTILDLEKNTATEIRGHESSVVEAEFSPDGDILATSSHDGTLRLWSPYTGIEIAKYASHSSSVIGVDFSPDGSQLVTSSFDKSIRFWDLERANKFIGHDGYVVFSDFSPDGELVVTSSTDKTARVWSLKNGSQVAMLRGHNWLVESATFDISGTRILTYSHDGTARIWNSYTGEIIHVLEDRIKYPIEYAAFSPDGTLVVTTSSTETVWDADTGDELFSFEHLFGVSHISFSPDSKKIITAGDGDWIARIWDAQSGDEVLYLEGHSDSLKSAQFSPDGTKILTTSLDRSARVWDAVSGAEIAKLDDENILELDDIIWDAQFSKDGEYISIAYQDGTVRIWNSTTYMVVHELVHSQNSRVSQAFFSSDGKRLISASNDAVVIWDVLTGTRVSSLSGHRDNILHVSSNADSSRIATASRDNTMWIWNGLADRFEWTRDEMMSLGCERISLTGFSKFAENSPILAGFNPDGSALNNPCERVGMKSFKWWSGSIRRLWNWNSDQGSHMGTK